MTTIDETSPRRERRDWESPGRLLRRYVEAAGIQAFGAMLCVAGFVALVIGWWRVSKESIVALQIPYLVSGGIGGALLLGMGGVLLLTHDLRLDNRRLEAVEEALHDLRAAMLEEAARDVAPTPTTAFVRVAGGTRVHRADCSAAAGKAVTVLDEQAVAGMVPCRLCSPALAPASTS
jgi:hypothetical protein